MPPKKPKSPAAVAKPQATEFVVLRIGDSITPGATVTFVGSAPTEKKAMELVNQLADSSAARLVLLEKKKVILRRPAMAVTEVDESLTKR